jgi:heptaprenylglyceryl phosphate synthase
MEGTRNAYKIVYLECDRPTTRPEHIRGDSIRTVLKKLGMKIEYGGGIL